MTDRPLYFVMAAGRPKFPGSHIILVCGFTSREAHETAAKEHRYQQGLASSVHVQTERLYDADTEDEGRAFIERLTQAMDEKGRASNSTAGVKSP